MHKGVLPVKEIISLCHHANLFSAGKIALHRLFEAGQIMSGHPAHLSRTHRIINSRLFA
ncbi:MAG TPA: hypothetical protein PLR22_09855 [Saprospiraceae bacterium]|nr:hypothetical protein [Saprospiraceae bacterium]